MKTQNDKRGEGEPIFLNVGKRYELCRFPGTGQWSLRLKLENGDVAHRRYLDEQEVEMVEAALAYTPSHVERSGNEWRGGAGQMSMMRTDPPKETTPSTNPQKLPEGDSEAEIDRRTGEWDALNAAIKEHVEGYYMPGEGGDYTPPDEIKAVIYDCIAGLWDGDVLAALSQIYPIRSRFAASATAPITDNDRRWRHLEHGCQWVSWTETGGETHSFDPRDVKYLKQMRACADEQSAAQVKKLREESNQLLRRPDGGKQTT